MAKNVELEQNSGITLISCPAEDGSNLMSILIMMVDFCWGRQPDCDHDHVALTKFKLVIEVSDAEQGGFSLPILKPCFLFKTTDDRIACSLISISAVDILRLKAGWSFPDMVPSLKWALMNEACNLLSPIKVWCFIFCQAFFHAVWWLNLVGGGHQEYS